MNNVKKHEHIYNKKDLPSTIEMKFRRKLYPDVSVIEERRVQCTACLKDIKHIILYKRKAYVHKHLDVLLCKDCHTFYDDGDFSVDEDGLDKYCRWCGQGGQLYICSECPCAFCKKCIKQNLARSAINAVEADDWRCFMCNDEPLRELKALCWAVNEHIQNLKNKRRSSSVKKSEKPKPIQQIKPIALKAIDLPFSNNNLECKQIVQKAKLTVKAFETELNSFCTTLKRRIIGSTEISDKIDTACDVNQCIRNINCIINQSFQTLNTFQESVNNFQKKWEKDLKNAVDKTVETVECSPEIICLDDNNINNDSDCEEILTINKSLNNSDKNKKIDRSIQIEPKEVLEVILDDNDEDTPVESKTEQVVEPDDDKEKTVAPRLRIKNVDELNGVVKIDKDDDDTSEEVKVNDSENKKNEGDNNLNDDSVSIIFESDNDTTTCNLNLIDKTNNSNKELENKNSEENKSSQVDSRRSSVDSVDQNKESNSQTEKTVEENVKEMEPVLEKKPSIDSSDGSLFSSDSSDNVKTKKKLTLKKKRNDSDTSSSKEKNIRKKNKTSVLSLIDNSSISDSSDSSISFTNKQSRIKEAKHSKESEQKHSSDDDGGKDDNNEEATKFFSSSEDDLRKLLDLKSLKKKRKHESSSSNSGSDSSNTKKDVKANKKKSKTADKELSLLDCLGDSDQENENCEKLENELELPSLRMDYNSLSVADHLLQLMSNSEDDRPAGNSSDDGDDSDKKTKKSTIKKQEKEKVDSENKKSSTSGGGSKYKYDKLLSTKLTDTDSSEAEEKWRKLKEKEAAAKNSDESNSGIDENRRKVIKEKKKKNKKTSRFFSSDSSDATVNGEDSASSSDEKSGKEKNDEEKTPPPKSRRRRRIKALSSGSDKSSADEDPAEAKLPDSGSKSRKNIRKVLKEENLQESTQTALKEEEERKKRIAEKQKLYNTFIANAKQAENGKELDEVVLDFDTETKKPLLALDKNLVKKLKPHQAEGIKFMWDSCFESLEEAKKNAGSGCILAHCMGLGKSLQVVSLLHTLLNNSDTGINTALIVCPVSTVLNWVNEFDKWLKDVGSGHDIEVFHMAKTQTSYRVFQLKEWRRCGGVMILGYNLYRILANEKIKVKASAKAAYRETLVDPGPDIVICDEGHLLKNEQTAISVAMNKIKTRRRIVLTGTPLQNNLVEYHCMVQFVKPNLLGTKKEFKNRFVHPIQNGQFEDSTAHDVKVMKRRAHVLHKMLDGIVQRKDYNVLTPYLPPKYEYVIHLKMSNLQCTLYQHYLDNLAERKLFIDFQSLMRICIHPQALLMKSEKDSLKEEEEDDSEGSLKKFIDDGSDSSSSSSSLATSSASGGDSLSNQPSVSRRKTRATAGEIEEEEIPVKKSEWWSELVSDEQLEDITTGTKIFLFFVILKYCEEIGDKLLVFSQSLFTLDVLEYFLNKIDEESQKSEPNPGIKDFAGSWAKGLDYFRMDGASSFDNRNSWCKAFNSERNTRARLFLISTRAGGLGINLTGANRVIIFDASWNPSYDVQSLFRVFRFGQTKPCYIYRFLSKGTMEEKIYERQVAKLSTSLRVIDEHQIDRHFSSSSLAELYTFDPEGSELRATPVLPKDRVMAELIQSHSDIILSYHQHDSLLENQEDEGLTEEERKAAWIEFENEKQPKPQFFGNNLIVNEIEQKLKEQMPNSTDEEIKKRALDILYRYQQLQFQQQQQQQQQFQQQQFQQQQFQQQQHKEFVQKMQQQFQQKFQAQQMPVRFPTMQQLKPATMTSPFTMKTSYQPYRFPPSVVKQYARNPKAMVNTQSDKPSTSSTSTSTTSNSTSKNSEPTLVTLLSDD